MDFHVMGDASAYEGFGIICSNYIKGDGALPATCYNGIRPTGIMLYYALPMLISSDPITIKVITLLMNLLCLGLLLVSCVSIFRTLLADRMLQYSTLRARLSEFFIVVGVLVLVVGFVPIRMPDLQGAAFFAAAVALLASEKCRMNSGLIILSGLCAGIAVLLKQNYVVPTFFLGLFWFVLAIREHIGEMLKSILLFLVGFSICLLQVALVYHNVGTPWFYDPAALAYYDIAEHQPYVELVAYTIPGDGAYTSVLAHHLSFVRFVSVRFFEGFYKFYWTVYLGNIPLHKTPTVLNFSHGRLNFIMFSVVSLFAASLFTFKAKNKWVFTIAMAAFLSALTTATLMHTENRYYLPSRILFFVLAIVVTNLLYDFWHARRHRANPVDTPQPRLL